MNAPVLTLPGWQGSGPGHWQSLWETRHGDRRVEQHDWLHPLRGDWMARLEEALLAEAESVWLAAHSLGCQLVAAWAAHSRHASRVRGALLVAPPDVERDDMPPPLPGWRPIARARLPFPATVVASSDDPYCSLERAAGMAGDWGAGWASVGPRGHLNADSGLGDWPEGRALLEALRTD
jgi:predicted alpha/beta hydrolase family esterase